jgi:hypothetical protein
MGALLLHAAVVAATLFTWEHRLDIAQESPPVVPVDLVTIAQKTNIAPETRVEPQIKPQELPVAQVQPEQFTPPPPIPEERTEAAPDQVPSQPVIKTPPPPAVPRAKPQTDAKKNKFDVDNVLAMLDRTAPQTAQQNGKVSARTHKGFGAQNAMTMDLADLLKNQIEQRQCWDRASFSGAPHPEQLVVYIDLALNPDGSVARPPQLTAQTGAAAASNPFFRAAADAALRAIYVCAPFKLPADRYAEWRDSTIEFDPRDSADQ